MTYCTFIKGVNNAFIWVPDCLRSSEECSEAPEMFYGHISTWLSISMRVSGPYSLFITSQSVQPFVTAVKSKGGATTFFFLRSLTFILSIPVVSEGAFTKPWLLNQCTSLTAAMLSPLSNFVRHLSLKTSQKPTLPAVLIHAALHTVHHLPVRFRVFPNISLYFWPYSSPWLLWIITSRDLACCYLCLWARHWKPLLAADWMAAGFSRAVESDLLHSIFYSRPQWPGALRSSWNTLLCDRCHIKQRSPRHQPASEILPLSLCSGLSARLTLDCISVCACV